MTKKFFKAILDENVKAFIIYINSFAAKITSNLAQEVQIPLLVVKKTIILAKYLNFFEVLLKE